MQNSRENERLTGQLVYAGDVRLAAQAWDSGDLRHYTDLLDGLKRSEPSLCGFEWSDPSWEWPMVGQLLKAPEERAV